MPRKDATLKSEPVHIALSQSDFMGGREESEHEASEAFNAIAPYATPELFPADARHLVIWGLDDVLMKISPKIEEAYRTRMVEALEDTLPKGTKFTEADATVIKALVTESYEKNGQPAHLVAREYGVDERMLMANAVGLVAYKDIALQPYEYGMADQGLLNYFEAARHEGIRPVLITSSSTNFAQTCLHYSALTQYFEGRIYGVDAVNHDQPGVVTKRRDGVKILKNVLAGVPQERYRDITVVDHNPAFLNAARSMGLNAVMVDMDGTGKMGTNVTPEVFKSPQDVLMQKFGVKPQGSHRDTHFYAGINMAGPAGASPK